MRWMSTVVERPNIYRNWFSKIVMILFNLDPTLSSKLSPYDLAIWCPYSYCNFEVKLVLVQLNHLTPSPHLGHLRHLENDIKQRSKPLHTYPTRALSKIHRNLIWSNSSTPTHHTNSIINLLNLYTPTITLMMTPIWVLQVPQHNNLYTPTIVKRGIAKSNMDRKSIQIRNTKCL